MKNNENFKSNMEITIIYILISQNQIKSNKNEHYTNKQKHNTTYIHVITAKTWWMKQKQNIYMWVRIKTTRNINMNKPYKLKENKSVI